MTQFKVFNGGYEIPTGTSHRIPYCKKVLVGFSATELSPVDITRYPTKLLFINDKASQRWLAMSDVYERKEFIQPPQFRVITEGHGVKILWDNLYPSSRMVNTYTYITVVYI